MDKRIKCVRKECEDIYCVDLGRGCFLTVDLKDFCYGSAEYGRDFDSEELEKIGRLEIVTDTEELKRVSDFVAENV